MLSGPTLIAVVIFTILLMLGLGTTLTAGDFRRVTVLPRGVSIGLASQYGWMPLLGFTAAVMSGLPNELAIGLMLMTCASGGNASNMFSWFARADVALSVTMTAISSALSVIAMPLLLSFYTSRFTEADLQMPYREIVGTLVAMLVPLSLGMLLRRRRPDIAARMARTGKWAGAAVLAIVLWVGAADLLVTVTSMSAQTLGSCLAVASAGMLLGFLAARVGGLGLEQQRAVAFETGIQNTPVVIAIVLVSFPEERQMAILQMPLLYATFVQGVALIATVMMLGYDRVSNRASGERPSDPHERRPTSG
jgi:bile acid transporter